MEEVGQSTSADPNETVLLEMSQVFIRQLNESKDREAKLQEKIRILEKEREVQNGTAVSNQQQQHGVQELRQQITELTQQFRQLKSVSDEKVQRLSNEVARLETEAKDKDAKIKDIADRENAHQSAIGDTRTTTPMNELRNSLATHARDLLNRMDQAVRSIHGDEDSGGRACLQSPERARRVPATNIETGGVLRHEEPGEDLQKKFDELAGKSRKRLEHIRWLERENDKLQQQLGEAGVQLEEMRAESEARDQQLANKDDQERDRLNAATQELEAKLEEANEEIEGLKQNLDVNEYRLMITQYALSEAEERIERMSGADVERKLEEYEESCVELRRLQREIDDLKAANEEAWRQVDDLRKTNDDMNANIAQAINEKESAVERIGEITAELQTTKFEKSRLQTRVRRLEDDNERLKGTIELFEDEQEATVSHVQQTNSSYETQIAELEHIVSRVTEDAERGQRTLQDEITKLKEDLRQANMANSMSRGSGNTSSPTAMGTTAVEARQPAVENHANGSRDESGGSNQRANVHATQERGASSSYIRTIQNRKCTTCDTYPANAYSKPCGHVIGCDICLKRGVEQKKKCSECLMLINDWAYIPLR